MSLKEKTEGEKRHAALLKTKLVQIVVMSVNKCSMQFNMLGTELSIILYYIVEYIGHLCLLQALPSTDMDLESEAHTV